MSFNPRFTLTLTLRDSHGMQQPISMAVGIDDNVRISAREVGNMKAGFTAGPGAFDAVVTLMKTREFRKALFIEAATRLGAKLAERMEDAEGWHDASRVEPAREQLGGEWDR